MARIPDADLENLDRPIRAVLEAQAAKWGEANRLLTTDH